MGIISDRKILGGSVKIYFFTNTAVKSTKPKSFSIFHLLRVTEGLL